MTPYPIPSDADVRGIIGRTHKLEQKMGWGEEIQDRINEIPNCVGFAVLSWE